MTLGAENSEKTTGLLGYCFQPLCPDGQAGGRMVGGGKKFVQTVSQKL